MKLNGLPTLVSKIWTRPEIKAKPKVTLSMCAHRKGDINIISRILPIFGSDEFEYSWAPMIGEADICQGRSRIASNFYMKTDDEAFVFIDDDIIFEEKDLTKIVRHALNGKLICGAMYVQKGTLGKTLVLEDGESITFAKDAMPQKVVSIPTGFMAISRQVFTKILQLKRESGDPLIPLCNEGASWEHYPFFSSREMKIDGKWRAIPEDWRFCLLARMAGVDVWCDPSILISHVGDYAYDLRDRVRPPKMAWTDFGSMTLT